MVYLGFAVISPIALVAAPLGLLFAFQRPGRREAFFAALLLGMAAWSVTHAEPGFDRFAAAWVCLLAGGTAVALTLWPPGSRPLVATGLLAVGAAALAAVTLVGVTSFSWAELRWLTEHHYGAQMRLVLGLMARSAQGLEGAGELVTNVEATGLSVVKAVGLLLPGLVLLQSVAALTAAWALYRALARHPEGDPLPRLREFRFSDHLIWGVVLALVALVLPGAGAVRSIGGNLATFFGGLYVARGVAVVAALAATAGVGGPLAVLFALVFTALLLPVAMFAALALGVTDTWVDWRRLAAKAKAE